MGKVLYPTEQNPNGDWIEFDDKWSGKDYTHKSLKDEVIPKGTVIYASCFYQEASEDATKIEEIQKHIFPEDMTEVTFYNCNLNNVYIPPHNTVIDPCGRTKLIKVQNDREDWIIDGDLKPVEPVNKKKFLELGLSIDPKDIPKNKLAENICSIREKELTNGS